MAATSTTDKNIKLVNFRYVAQDTRGVAVKGNIKGISEIAVERLLIERGLTPTNIEIVPSMFSLEEALPSLFKVKPKDVVVFSRQLATLLRSGISLLPALELLQEQQTASRAFRKILESVVYDLRSGMAFSNAISKHDKAFSDMYCRTMAVGEETGSLIDTLNRMADYQEKQGQMAQKVGKALTYPAMVLGVGLVVVLVLMTAVMPKLLDMFTSMNVELPLPTLILINVSGFLSSNTIPLIAGLAVVVAAFLWMLKQPSTRRFLDKVQITLPLIGTPGLMMELGRFARSVSVLVHAGLKLNDIMEMVPQSTPNTYFRKALNQVKEGLLLGEGLSTPMSRIEIFSPLLVQMVAIGEESNTLDFTMGVVADFYETNADEKTAAMLALIGPVSTITIALLVGFLAMAVIMPMYSLTGTFG